MRHLSIRVALISIASVTMFAVLPAAPALAQGLMTEDLSGTLTPDDLASILAGPGVSVSNVTYMGVDRAAGTFTGGSGIIDFEEGVILSSGDIANVVGPNVEDGITAVNGTPGDPDLDVLAGVDTFDAAVLEFDFVPTAGMVFFQYVFGSDEYNEFVNTAFNDVFAFFVNGVNCATVNGDPVSINTINNGNPFDTDPRSHPELYRNNDLDDGGGTIDTEMDGLTVVLTCEAPVTPNATNHMELAIADGSDEVLDSNVFLKQGSLTTEPPTADVVIDIKPGSEPNSIRLSNRGVIPVAILTTETFDATTVDPMTVCFGDAEEPGERDCTEAHGVGHLEDVDGDGDIDQLFHFETAQTGIDPGDTQACLTGETFDGTPVEACDSIRTL